MADMPWSKFFWADWESDQSLRLCSLAAQGLWMRMLCVCARSEPYGYLAINDRPLDVSDIARLAGVMPTEAGELVAELERNGVFSRDRKGRVYSRRLVRDRKRSEEGRKHVKKRWTQASEIEGEKPSPNRGPNRQATPQKPEARSQSPERTPLPPQGEQPFDVPDRSPDQDRFPDFWAAYPRKENQTKAEAEFITAAISADAEAIIAGARKFAVACSGQEPRFIPLPASWLRDKRWRDQISTVVPPDSAKEARRRRLARIASQYPDPPA